MTGPQILVVEDEKIVAMDLQNMLKGLNYSLTPAAGTAGEALQRVATHRPDLVLMDIRLQGPIDGIAAARQIRDQFGIPVIYVTAHSDEHTLQLAKDTEPYGYIIKPFERDEIRSAIEVALYKHKMETRLKESEQWLSAILIHTADAVIATDAKGHIAFMNPAAELLTRRKPSEARGQEWREIFRLVDDKNGGLPTGVVKAFREGVAAEFPPETHLETKDGLRHPVAGSVAPIRDHKDAVVGYVFALRDISQRRKLEEELRQSNAILEKRVQERTETLAQANRELTKEISDRQAAEAKARDSEAKFRSMAESAVDAIFLLDKAGKILYANKGARSMFAYGAQEILDKDVRHLLAEADRPRLDELVLRFGIEGEDLLPADRMMELRGRDKFRREFPIELSLASWTADDHPFYVAILRETTERHRAESHLRFQAGILAQVSDAIFVINNDRQIIYWNAAAEKLYGVPLINVIGKKKDEVVADFWGDPAKGEAARAAVETDGVWRGELTQRKKDGSILDVDASIGTLKNEEGKNIGQLILVRDVSERKKLQGFLLHSEKLAAMGQMAAAVAHELKTPMSVIFGFADIILGKFKGEDSETKGHLETIKHQVLRCTDLVNNLLDFSRKQKPREGGRTDVSESVKRALALVEPYARSRGVRVDTRLAAEPLTVEGARDLLEQVVINLSTNGIDAMPRGGTLSIETACRPQDGRVIAELRIADTGTGIPPEVKERIYEPFFSTKAGDGRKGTGLGLWLVREIVTGLLGEIECRSELGQGTTLTVRLPVTAERKEEVPTPG